MTMVSDPLDVYLEEIGRVSLLTHEKLRALARKVQAGRGREAARAREAIVRANLRLVVNIAKKYFGCGLCLQDLIAEGNIGLIRAAEKFDPTRDNTFSTYAAWWIKQSICKALTNTSKTVRIPSYMREIIANWREVALELEQLNGRSPTVREIVAALDVPPQNVDAVERAILASEGLGKIVSIDAGENGFDVDRNYRLGFGGEEPDADLERVQHLVERLDDKRAKIIRLRFGFGSGQGMTLQQVAKVMGLTRERVRQIEKDALAKLKLWAMRQPELSYLAASA